jgi:hypothetical protein
VGSPKEEGCAYGATLIIKMQSQPVGQVAQLPDIDIGTSEKRQVASQPDLRIDH